MMSEKIAMSSYDKKYDEIRKEENPIKKKIKFLGWLSTKLKERGKTSFPVLVGGSAIQYYTNGAYTSIDMDVLWGDGRILTDILTPYGFKREGRYWYSDEDNLVLEAPGYYYGEKIMKIETDYGVANILSVENVILDRLEGYVWTQREDDYIWAKNTFEAVYKSGGSIDIEFLEREAIKKGVASALYQIFYEVGFSSAPYKTEEVCKNISDTDDFDDNYDDNR